MRITVTEAINLAHKKILSGTEKSLCMGLGINDPKRIFGTCNNLLEEFGPERIIEPPTSENALTGIVFGLALKGYSSCLIHQRLDFSLLSFDQIINTLSKWKFMFGDKDDNTNCLIRMIVGRGWGQGPTHSQSYHSFFASLPGIDLYYPYDPKTFYMSVIAGMKTGKPSILIEHRWLHNVVDINFQPKDDFKEIFNINSITEGEDFTLFTYGYIVPEAIKACNFLKDNNIFVNLITTSYLSKIDLEVLKKSLKKSKKLLVIEPFYVESSLSSSLITKLICNKETLSILKEIDYLSLPFENESTSYFKTKDRYINWIDIVQKISKSLKKTININPLPEGHHDVPGEWFKGPF